MGRSVNYLNNAEYVLYFPFECGEDENGQYDDDFARMCWDDLKMNLQYTIKARLKSYRISDKWDNRETKIILENDLCIIGISEYCDLVSLSVAVKDNEYDNWHENFAKRHAEQIKGTLEKAIDYLGLKRLGKVGTFSNGEAFFKTVK